VGTDNNVGSRDGQNRGNGTWHDDDVGRPSSAFSPIPKMEMSVSELRGGGMVFKGGRGVGGVARKSLADVVTELIGVPAGGSKAEQGEDAWPESQLLRKKEGQGGVGPDVREGKEGGLSVSVKRIGPPREEEEEEVEVVGVGKRGVSRGDARGAAVVAGGGWRAGADLEVDINLSRTDSSGSVRDLN
jgi:hypothetical protein